MRQKAYHKPPAHTSRTGRRGRNLPAALCGFVGRLALVLVILACLPVPLAHLCGYEMYNIISGSMEPAIPVGSAVYVRAAEPSGILPGEVIAFQSGSSVITHRVIENDTAQGSIITKGDANTQADLAPVWYNEIVGRVEFHIPVLGGLLGIYAGGPGRSYLIALAAAGALLSVVGTMLGGGKAPAEAEDSADGAAANSGGTGKDAPGGPAQAGSEAAPARSAAGGAAGAPAARGRRVRHLLMAVLAVIFIVSVGGILVIRLRQARQRQTYLDTAQQYTSAVTAQQQTAPIEVDFDALCAANEDVEGWIYCEGTVIDYPVMHGATNDTYLRRDINMNYSNAGSIFIEVLDQCRFADSNTVIYGHNMGDGSMFACLSQWQEQEWFDAHPVMWLLTPEQNYKVLLFSAYQTEATSDTYTVFTGPCEQLDAYLLAVAEQSAVEAQVPLDGDAKYILLSTCGTSYGSDLRRNVLHGMLVPVD